MAELNIAVVGCNGPGAVHLRCWSNLSGVRIAAICDTDGHLAARTAAQYPGSAAFTDLRALLAAETMDIVDICAPVEQHFVLAETALRAGAHVLCEKPLTVTVEEAEALIKLASDRERLLMTAFPHRFHPAILFAKDLLENDDLGRPTMFRCRFSGYWPEAVESIAEGPGASAHGALQETAIHGIDLFRYLVGEIESIQGKIATNNPDLTVEDSVALLLEGPNHALGVVEANWSSPGGRNVVEIYGTAGACLVDYDAGTVRYLTADQPIWRHHDEGGPNRFEREIAHFADAVRGLQPLIVTGQDGARAVELCAEVYRQNAAL